MTRISVWAHRPYPLFIDAAAPARRSGGISNVMRCCELALAMRPGMPVIELMEV